MRQSTTFRELGVGTNNHFLMARLLNIWSECESNGAASVSSMHMLWLDKEGQLMEANVRYEDAGHICKNMKIGCLYTMMNPTVIPAKSERRTAPSNLRLYFAAGASFKSMQEYRSTMHFPDDSFLQVPFTDSVSSASVPICYSDIIGCVTHITEPIKVNSDTSMFQIHIEDISGNKGLVSYIGKGIKEFIHSADYKEVHYPLVVTATAVSRNVHDFSHIPPFCFVTSPGTRLIVHSYNDMTKELMNRLYYELQAECESGNQKAKIILNHAPALALIRMPPLEFQTMSYDQRIQLLKELCDIKFMAEVYIIGSEFSDEPQIRMYAIWHPKAFQPLMDLKLEL
ncbi:unnamed protein product [Linum trigynum]|uniref:Uncharacterized protein n=1 Tax=Linum trigynum TaxID=586398 RepID=A0AAV2FIQ6_9ROSI